MAPRGRPPRRRRLAADAVAGHVGRGRDAHRVEEPRLRLADGAGIERRRRLHADVGQHLHEVVLEHVADDAGVVVILAPRLHAHRLGRRDLDVVHVRGVPERLEHRVGQAEGEQVLHRLLPEVVVDPIDLLLPPPCEQVAVQGDGRVEVLAEGLLHDDASPAREPREAGLVEEPVHRGEEVGRDREVEDGVARGPVLGGGPVHGAAEPVVGGAVAEVARGVVEPRLEPLPAGRVELAAGVEPGDVVALLGAEGRRVEVAAGHAHHGEALGQEAVAGEVVERRHQEPLREVPRRAEDHEHPWCGERVLAGADTAGGLEFAALHGRESYQRAAGDPPFEIAAIPAAGLSFPRRVPRGRPG